MRSIELHYDPKHDELLVLACHDGNVVASIHHRHAAEAAMDINTALRKNPEFERATEKRGFRRDTIVCVAVWVAPCVEGCPSREAER